MVMEYVAKFTQLARFTDDYVATDMEKVRKFENGLKLSIRGKIVGLLLYDMDSMVKMAMTIEIEIEDARRIRAKGISEKRKDQPSSSSGKRQKTSAPRAFEGQGRGYQGQGQTRVPSQSGPMICFHFQQSVHFRREAGIPGPWDTSVPVIGGTRTYAVCSFLP